MSNRPLLRVAWRGFLIVFLVALNTRLIALGNMVPAVLVGGCISATWWSNARSSVASSHPWAMWAYAGGAMAGTAVALAITR